MSAKFTVGHQGDTVQVLTQTYEDGHLLVMRMDGIPVLRVEGGRVRFYRLSDGQAAHLNAKGIVTDGANELVLGLPIK